MTIYERVRAINGAAKKTHRKEVNVEMIQRDFAKHFEDSIDYQSSTTVNGTLQPLIVSRNKSVVTEKKIYAYPGQTIPLGAVVECFNCKWLVTEVDPNRELYTSAKMEQCNREITWQNPNTLEILTRWCTLSKPYFSNLNETEQTTMSSRQYKLQIPYDEETSLLDVDMRFMLEIIGGEPKTYRITCVDPNTERYEMDGSLQGFLLINVEQDQYIPEKDNVELMICDYIKPDTDDDDTGSSETTPDYTSKITATSSTDLKIGGSFRTYTGAFYDADGNAATLTPKWTVTYLDEFAEYVVVEESGSEVKVKVKPNSLMEGSTIKITLTDDSGNYESSIECKVVALI